MKMYTRERVLLAFLLLAPRKPTKTILFKWLFLCQEQTSIGKLFAFYDFLPTPHGPFSFVAQYELNRIANHNLIDLENLQITTEKRHHVEELIGKLDSEVQNHISQILFLYGQMNYTELSELVDRQYPWYASRSKLDSERQERVADPAVYTIGYEGRSVDAFLNHLIRHGVRQVIDVRCNAYSQKYGFTRGVLEPLCRGSGINYVHIPELGIPSNKRGDLATPAAYKRLFQFYEEHILPNREEFIEFAGKLLLEDPSTLLCFEADHCMCHRGNLSQVLSDKTALKIVHL